MNNIHPIFQNILKEIIPMKTQTELPMCEYCETEIIEGLGCDCGRYEPGFDKVAYFVERATGYKMERS